MINRSLNKQIAKSQANSEKIIFLKEWQEQIEPHLRAYRQILVTLNDLLNDTQQNEQRTKRIEICKATLGTIQDLLIPKLEAFTNNLERFDFIRVTKKQTDTINQCLLQIYEVGCLLLGNNILLSSLSIFMCEGRLRNFITVHSLPLTENPIRTNHVESLNSKFFSPPCWLGLIHTALKLLKIYKLTNQDPELVNDLIEKLNNDYFKQCEIELTKTTESKTQCSHYYQVCKAAYALLQNNIDEAIDLLTKFPEHQIKDDHLKKFIFELYAATCHTIATHFYDQQKDQEALFWFNNCRNHVNYLLPDYQNIVKTKIEELESKQKTKNLPELTELNKTFNTEAIHFEIHEAEGILRIQVFNKMHAYLLRKGLLKSKCHFDEDHDTFMIDLVYCPTKTIKRCCTAISHMASCDVKAPYIPYELVDTLPTFQDFADKPNVETESQQENEQNELSKKEQKLARHLENELKRQQSKNELENKEVESKVTAPNEKSKPKSTSLAWNKNYPSINKNSTKGTLVQEYSERKCYYHFFLHSSVSNEIAMNQILDEKVQTLTEDPTRSFGKQGILFTSDRAGNRFFKLKIAGLGNGLGARIGGYIDDVVYDDENNPHFAVNLDILKLKHL